MTCLLNVLYILVKYLENILKGFRVMVRTKFYNFGRLWEITLEPSRLGLSILHATLLPNALYNLTKFHENSSKGIGVMGRTRFRLQTDGFLIELGFNDTSTLMGHFVSSPRERERKDRRDSRGDEREGQGRKRNRNESEETEEIKTSPSTLTCYKDCRPCPAVSQYQLGAPVT